jgi:hypothetical protein
MKKMFVLSLILLVSFCAKAQDENLYNAIRQGDRDLVQKMIGPRPDVLNKADSRGFTPLILATYSDQYEVARYLLEAGAEVDQLDRAGNTALMGVAFKGSGEMAGLLLKHGADINRKNSKGFTALSYACQFGNTDVARALLQEGADASIADNEGLTPLYHARVKGHDAIVALLEE